MKLLKSKKGMTLVEILVALAVLGILVVPILSMFDSSISQIFNSGFRTTEIMKVQKIVDGLQTEVQTQQIVSVETIDNYLNYDYQFVSSPENLTSKPAVKTGNYYRTTIGGINGWEVTIVRFYKHGTGFQSTQISTFVPKS